jgi:acyl-coenzyme A synthetase/AMP-(fatty) acid ligase
VNAAARSLEKLRPDDHFLVLLEGDDTPIHIGSLLVLDVPGRDRDCAGERLRLYTALLIYTSGTTADPKGVQHTTNMFPR